MNRGILIGLILLIIGAGAGAGVTWWLLGGAGTPSGPISAPTLSLDMTEEADPAATEIAQLRAEIDAALGGATAANDSTRVANIRLLAQQVEAMGAATPSAAQSSAVETPLPETASAGRGLYRINAELSEVRFIIYEELFGNPKDVVGGTHQVAGDIIVDYGSAASSRVGEIRINARTLETDDENRTRALRNQILQSRLDDYEFISFVPTALSGLSSGPVAVGDTVTFQITGDLTVRNITQPVTFDATATLVSEQRLQGSATATTTRAAFQLSIPNAPGVANVADEVALEIDFVADLVEST